MTDKVHPSNTVFVGGISWKADENSLREFFAKYGEVLECKIIVDRETGKSKGYGFVSFADAETAQRVKKATDLQYLGKMMNVGDAYRKSEPRTPGSPTTSNPSPVSSPSRIPERADSIPGSPTFNYPYPMYMHYAGYTPYPYYPMNFYQNPYGNQVYYEEQVYGENEGPYGSPVVGVQYPPTIPIRGVEIPVPILKNTSPHVSHSNLTSSLNNVSNISNNSPSMTNPNNNNNNAANNGDGIHDGITEKLAAVQISRSQENKPSRSERKNSDQK